VDKVLPVDSYVPGCCPKPEAIIDGIVLAMAKLEEKAEKMKHQKADSGQDAV
jgi:ech hydrogenase subunit C